MNNRLKVLRAMRDWSQAELAGRLDVSRQAINAIETGKYDPGLPLAFKIARHYIGCIDEETQKNLYFNSSAECKEAIDKIINNESNNTSNFTEKASEHDK